MDHDIDKLKEEWRSMGISESEISEKEKFIIEQTKDKPVELNLNESDRNLAIEYIKSKKSLVRSIAWMTGFSIASSLVMGPIAYFAGWYFKYGLVALGFAFIVLPQMTYWRSGLIIRFSTVTLYACTMFLSFVFYDIMETISKHGINSTFSMLHAHFNEFIKSSVRETLKDTLSIILTGFMGIFVVALGKGEFDDGDIMRAHSKLSKTSYHDA